MKELVISLGGTPYTVQEFTLGQLEDIHTVLGTPISSDVKDIWERYRRIIVIALAADHPDVTEEALKKMRLGTIQAVGAIFEQILQFGGFNTRKKAESEAGEAPARAA